MVFFLRLRQESCLFSGGKKTLFWFIHLWFLLFIKICPIGQNEIIFVKKVKTFFLFFCSCLFWGVKKTLFFGKKNSFLLDGVENQIRFLLADFRPKFTEYPVLIFMNIYVKIRTINLFKIRPNRCVEMFSLFPSNWAPIRVWFRISLF